MIGSSAASLEKPAAFKPRLHPSKVNACVAENTPQKLQNRLVWHVYLLVLFWIFQYAVGVFSGRKGGHIVPLQPEQDKRHSESWWKLRVSDRLQGGTVSLHKLHSSDQWGRNPLRLSKYDITAINLNLKPVTAKSNKFFNQNDQMDH